MVTPPPEIPRIGKIFFTLLGLGLILLSIIPLWLAVGWGGWGIIGFCRSGSARPDWWILVLGMLFIGLIPLVAGIMFIRQAYPKGRTKSPDHVGAFQAIVIALSERISEQRESNKE